MGLKVVVKVVVEVVVKVVMKVAMKVVMKAGMKELFIYGDIHELKNCFTLNCVQIISQL